jgi:LacI family transcriptional regulator
LADYNFFRNFMKPIAMNTKKDITIYDIAKKLNLSSATVSRALNDNPAINKHTRKKIQEAAKNMGYRHNTFASSLRNQKTNTIGVVMHELSSNFITSVLSGIEKATTDAGYNLIIAHSSENQKREIANVQNLFHKRVDGLLASLAFDTKGLQHYQPFFDKHIPVVFYDRVDENSDTTKVIINNYEAGYKATRHLVEQGCKRIVLLTSSLERNVYAERKRGYVAALKECGIPYKKDLVFIRDLSNQMAEETALQVLKMKPLPDGAFITHDFSAAAFMQVLKRHGIKTPQDMAIVGFNNDAISTLIEPQLSTINYPGREMGEIAARTLINHLEGVANSNQMKTIIIKSELIVRESSLKKHK